jgi:lysozyme family protein
MSSKKRQLIDSLNEREGGYVNHKNDRGGETNHGITLAVARRNGWSGPMRDMTRQFAFGVYERKYWTSLSLDSINSNNLQETLFDYCVHSGPSRPGKALQRSLNVLNHMGDHYADLVVDGKVGPATLRALEGLLRKRGPEAYDVLAGMVDGMRQEFLIRLAEKNQSQESFSWGWAHRVFLLGRGR